MNIIQEDGTVHTYHYTSQGGEEQEVLHWGCLRTSHTSHVSSPPCRYPVAWRKDDPKKIKSSALTVLQIC